jgi:hypothetical protein
MILRLAMFVLAASTGWIAHAQVPADSAASPPGVQPAIPAPITEALPPNRWTAAQIREAFQLADVNGDGQLTRAEAQRLPIMPRTFEDSDLNKDGVLTLGEYQSSFAPP